MSQTLTFTLKNTLKFNTQHIENEYHTNIILKTNIHSCKNDPYAIELQKNIFQCPFIKRNKHSKIQNTFKPFFLPKK